MPDPGVGSIGWIAGDVALIVLGVIPYVGEAVDAVLCVIEIRDLVDENREPSWLDAGLQCGAFFAPIVPGRLFTRADEFFDWAKCIVEVARAEDNTDLASAALQCGEAGKKTYDRGLPETGDGNPKGPVRPGATATTDPLDGDGIVIIVPDIGDFRLP